MYNGYSFSRGEKVRLRAGQKPTLYSKIKYGCSSEVRGKHALLLENSRRKFISQSAFTAVEIKKARREARL